MYISPKVTVCFATTDGHDDDNVCLVGISEHGALWEIINVLAIFLLLCLLLEVQVEKTHPGIINLF